MYRSAFRPSDKPVAPTTGQAVSAPGLVLQLVPTGGFGPPVRIYVAFRTVGLEVSEGSASPPLL